MKILLTLWLTLFSTFFVGLANPQNDEKKDLTIEVPTKVSQELENFKYLTVNDGFSRNTIYCILQDQKGYMWFGLWDGIYQYDGNELKFVMSTRNEEGQNITVNKLIEDERNNIWAGTVNKLMIWDMVHKKKSIFNKKTEKGDSITGSINHLDQDNFNNIWILAQENKIFLYNSEKDQLKYISEKFRKSLGKIQNIYFDRYENIWLATDFQGIVKLTGNKKNSNNPFDWEDWSYVKSPIFDHIEGMPYVVYQDNNENYWVGTNKSIYQIQITEREECPVTYKYANQPRENRALKVNAFNELDNTIYAATNQGLFTYDIEKADALWNLPNYTEEHHLNDKALTGIFIDREKGIWISTHYGGVNYVHPTHTNFSTYNDLNKQIEGHVISAISEDKNGNIWMGVEDNGVSLWNRKTNKIQNFNKNSDTPYCPTFNNVQGIYADDNYVYVGMFQGGLDIVNINTLESINLNSTNTGPSRLPNHVYAFHKYSSNTLLIGTLTGLYRMNVSNHKIRKIKEVRGKITSISEDKSGDLWVTTSNRGFYWYSKIKNSWWHYEQTQGDSVPLYTNGISTILPFNSTIYIGTQGNGLWEFNKNTKKFSQIANPSLNGTIIFKILPHGDNLWISTNQGLFALNRQTQQTKQFTIRDGLGSNQFKEDSGIITSDGLYLFGGLNGFNCFRPTELKYNDILPKVMLTDFYLFNKSANIHDSECPLKQSITCTQKLDLNQKHHSFAFKFSSSSYSDPMKNKFEYKLEPFDKEWQHTHGRSKLASYTNIPAGEYVFHVRTSNGQGTWSDERTLQLVIHPYWWLSWPMKAFYTLVVLFILGQFIIRYRNKKKKEMHMFRMEKEKEVYESKMHFFTCMVHEIRTPLTLILGPLKSAMDKKEHTVNQVLPDLQIVERNGRRLLSLVNQLMDFRKVEEKSYNIQLGEVDIKELILQISKDFRFYNIQKHVTFHYLMPEEACWAKIDHEAFTKILVNLLSNAMKFTKDEISISLTLSKDHKFWEFSVKDNGKGIALEEQKSIFESFYQVHQDLPGDYVGTGIGLFVVRRLAKLQGGDIRVESNIGKGANFITTLLYAEPPVQIVSQKDETDGALEKEKEENSIETQEQTKKRLLIVEDNEEMRNYISSLFTEKYEVHACENGKEALNETTLTAYDLVITDLMMPVMDGMTLTRTLKKQANTCHIPIIILTAMDDEISQKEGFESEADMYVTKPFSADILQSRVKSIFKNREHLRQQYYSEPETTTEVLYTNNSDKEFLEKLDGLINQRLSDCNLPVDELAAEMAMGRSIFYQKVKGVTGLTPNDYIRTFRLKKAVTLFQKGETRINEVCYRVGFSSPSYFTKRFTLQFGISPSDYLKKNSLQKTAE